jgi:hypothetical protein
MTVVLSLLSISIGNSGNPITPTVSIDQKTTNKYRINIPIASPGTYTITSEKLSRYNKSLTFYVRSGSPDASSQCSLSKYNSSPILQTSATLTYTCKLVDVAGYKVDAAWAKTKYNINYNCNMVKTKPSGALTASSTVSIANDTFTCTFYPNVMGDYQIEAYTTINSTKVTFTPQINTFAVYSFPPSIQVNKVYDYTRQSWIDYSQTKPVTLEVFII